MDAPDPADEAPGDEAADDRSLAAEARLARLSVPAERRAAVLADRERILAAFESLQAVDVEGVEPLHQPLVGEGAERDTRRDAPEASPSLADALLARGPAVTDDHFQVPKTVDA